MQAKYRHTQYGALMFVVFLLTGILIAVVAQNAAPRREIIPLRIPDARIGKGAVDQYQRKTFTHQFIYYQPA